MSHGDNQISPATTIKNRHERKSFLRRGSLHDRHVSWFFFAIGPPHGGALCQPGSGGPAGHRAARRQALKGGGRGAENKTFEIMSTEEDGQESRKKIATP